jgi:hypothetical protein
MNAIILFEAPPSNIPMAQKAKAAARNGRGVEIVDGKLGLLTAKPFHTLGELAAHAKGIYAGPRDLSPREGFSG